MARKQFYSALLVHMTRNCIVLFADVFVVVVIVVVVNFVVVVFWLWLWQDYFPGWFDLPMQLSPLSNHCLAPVLGYSTRPMWE